MPQIPKQYNRRLLPTASGGGGATRNVAAKATGGQAIGAALAGGAAGVASAFQDAQRRRDAANAKLDSLGQEVKRRQIALDARVGMQEDVANVEEQLKTQQHLRPEEQRVKFKDQDGNETEGMPDEVMKTLIQNRYDRAKSEAAIYGGAEAEAGVAADLGKDAYDSISTFRAHIFKQRHDKTVADWQVVTNRLEEMAADPSNRFRETAKQDLDDHISSGIKAGIFSPTDGVKLKETMKDSIADKWASATAARDPMAWLKMANATQAQGETTTTEGGANVPVGKLAKLPEDIRPEKIAHYNEIAFGALKHQQEAIDRKNKQFEAQTKQVHEQTFRDKMARVLNGESVAGELSQDLNENKLSAEQGDKLRATEHAFKTQNAEDPALKQASGMKLFDYTSTITKAKFGNGNLDEIEIQVSVDLERGEMLPADAQNVMKQISEAKGHLQSEAQQAQNQTIQAAHKNMIGGLRTTGPMDKYDALSEQAIEGADRDFYDELRRNPNADAWAIRDKVMKRWEPVVAERKNVTGEDAQVKLDDAKMQSMVQKGAMTPAGYKAWKEQGDTWRQIYKNAIEAQKHPPPPPTLMERMKEAGQQLKEAGSSFFQEADAGATE